MIVVNTYELKSEVSMLNKLIKEYEILQLNLYNEINDVCINWQDGKSKEFENKVILDKQESNSFMQNLKDQNSLLEYLCSEYEKLGKNIKCELNSKESVLASLQDCYSKAGSILNEFNNIDRRCYYYELNLIDDLKRKMEATKIKVEGVKNKIAKIYNGISDIESQVAVRLERLKITKINDFDFKLEEV